MPRDGSGIYSTPPGTHGTPNTTILSANYNSNVDDVAADLNTPRPIVAGGTGATTAAGALTALGAAPLASPVFTGDPQAPTPTAGDNDTSVATTAFVATAVASKVAKAGDTMSGSLTVTGTVQGTDVVGSNTVQSRSGNLYVLATSSGDARLMLMDEGSNIKSAILWERSTNTIIIQNTIALSTISLLSIGTVQVGSGIAGRTGTTGAYSVNAYNFNWDGTGLNGFINNSSLGYVQWQSDYRIKKDVVDLASTWEQVKALRPIKYTQAQFSPPSHVEYVAELRSKDAKADDIPGHLYTADDIERWGFIAHELQATLTPSAATGEKDSPDTIQSPNPFTLIAALTKALQEAMMRIEALEAA